MTLVTTKRTPERTPGLAEIARLLAERHEDVFPNERSAALTIAAVLEGLVEVLITHGAVRLKRVGTLQVVKCHYRNAGFMETKTGSGKPRVRRQLSFRASDLLLDQLNSKNRECKTQEEG